MFKVPIIYPTGKVKSEMHRGEVQADAVTFGALFVCLHVCLKLFKAVRIDEIPERNEFR